MLKTKVIYCFLFLTAMLMQHQLASAESNQKCISLKGRLNSVSLLDLALEEYQQISDECRAKYAQKFPNSHSIQIKGIKSNKSVSQADWRSCEKLNEQGLTHTAQLYCSQKYQSKWTAQCCGQSY